MKLPEKMTDKVPIVHKKQVEQAQAKEEALINSLSDGIIVRDQKYKITKINLALTEMLGYTEKELIGKRTRDVIKIKNLSGTTPSEDELTTRPSQETGRPVSGTFSWSTKEGGKIIVDVVTSPYRIDGKLAGTVTVARDVSEQAAIDRAKTEFVSLAAHQLRTPLSSINWYLEMLSDDAAGKLSTNQKDYLQEVMFANQRMVALVNDLLNVSHIDLGTFAIKPVPTDIEQVIKNVVAELNNQIAQKSLHITTAFSGQVDNFLIDPQLAHIVFQNLIGNAVKYTPEGGSIDIYAILDNERLLISIDDTGYGIPKSEQDKVFHKLFRADNVVKRDTEGTGLGLYLVKAIVEKAGGTIGFVSRVNRGSTFTVEFPSTGMKKQSGSQVLAAHRKHQPQGV